RRGIREQLIAATLSDVVFTIHDRWRSADYLAGVLQKSIAQVVVQGTAIMTWLKKIARTLAKENRSLKWTLPTGFVAIHEYRKRKARRIVTATRTLVIYEDLPSTRIDVRKQVNSIAPNFIHSLDATHMMLTVL